MTLREVPVEHDDTVAIFCERYGCTADQIKLWNVDSADDINRAINPNIKSKAFYRLRRYLEKLKVPEEQAVAVEKAAAAANAEVNDDHLWLIYETRFNADDFKKLSKALAYGLYTLPLDPSRVEIAASRDMPEALRKAFFPFHTMERVSGVVQPHVTLAQDQSVIRGRRPEFLSCFLRFRAQQRGPARDPAHGVPIQYLRERQRQLRDRHKSFSAPEQFRRQAAGEAMDDVGNGVPVLHRKDQ